MNTSTKVLVGAAMLAAIGSGITAAGILDAWLPGSRIGRAPGTTLEVAATAPEGSASMPSTRRAAQETSQDYRARLLMLQTGGATFAELWLSASR